jgi:hypothetical protein
MKKKKKLIFHAYGKCCKMFSAENIFRENDLSENIFRWKSFYVEVNGALLENGFLSSFGQTDHNPTLLSFTLKTHAPHNSSLSLSILIVFFMLNKQLSLSVGISSTLIFLYFFVESYGAFHSLEEN